MNLILLIFSTDSNSKLQEVRRNSEVYSDLEDELDVLNNSIEKTKQRLRERVEDFRILHQQYQISQADMDIDRLIYKLNFSRQLALILLSTIRVDSVERAEELLYMSRKLSQPRNKEFFRKRLQENTVHRH